FISSLSLPGDLLNPGAAWSRAERIFTAPIDQIKSTAVNLVTGIIEIVKDAILKPIAKLAEGTEGYNLLKGVLGKDPITGDPVDRSAETLLGPLLKMIGLGDVWQKMQESKAIPRAWQWFQTTLSQLIGFVSEIPTLFLSAFKSLTLEDIILVPKAFAKLAAVFGGFMSKFVSWGVDAMFKLLEIVFDVVSPGALGYVKKTGSALKSIFQNPLPFVGNLVKAAKLGFMNFGGNFLTHLKKGLIDWLTGSLQGVYIPKALTLPEFGKLALSVLGITWAQIRGKIVKALGQNGEIIMQGLEAAFDIIKALVTGGPTAAWEVIKDKLTGLKDTIVSGIISFVVEAVVTKAIPKLIAMFIPGAGFISAIISIYDTVMVFVNKISKIIQVVTAFINSIVAIASGNIGAAASKVESILGGLLSLAISFLAGFVGLGKVTDKIMGVVNKVRGIVDKALDTAINFIIGKAKALFASLFSKKDKTPDSRTDAQKMADMKAAVSEGLTIVSDKSSSKKAKDKNLKKLKSKYKLTNIELMSDSKAKETETVHIHATINPTYDSNGIIISAFPPAPVVKIVAIVGAPIPRQGMEEVIEEKKGFERAHLLGPILGHDLPQGVMYAPVEVNQKLQKSGIEGLIKAMYKQRFPGAEFRVTLTATPHAGGGNMLASANYVLHGKLPSDSDWTFIFDYTIKVGLGASPSIVAKAGEPPDMEAINRFSTGVASLLARREGR
ncbi:MAG TPA: polymorphic toxin type 4 domain-containing protein, partial [Pyrinomonadaceae bacterium]|nr:polymorphic toxin type 4 domain-containing protein [Pyrinomonadaceae bacterium]